MGDIFRFPGGYDVKILRKEDVIASIEANIVDKDVALEIVKRCEIDAANSIKAGRWASIPYIGNIRVPRGREKFLSEETQALLKEAEATLDRDKYLLFRKSVAADIGKQVKLERYFYYQVSKFVGRNTKFFRKVAEKHGDNYARFLCYTLSGINIADADNYE